MNEKNFSQPLLSNTEWLWKVAFTRLDHGFRELNLKLQGKLELRVKHILQLNHFDATNIV